MVAPPEKKEGRVMGPEVLLLERKVARCRILLSLFAIVAFTLINRNAALLHWSSLAGTARPIGSYVLFVLGAHLGYSIAVYGCLMVGLVPRAIVAITTAADILAGTAVAYFTEGPTSPFYVFFAFAVVAAGVRSGFRFAIAVTAVSVWLYLALVVVAASRGTADDLPLYIMRPAYLAIIGYLVAYLGRLRMNLEGKLGALERARERGEIARALHDGCVQTLAGTNLTLGSCQELVRRGRADEAIGVLHELQTSLTREYDALRTYIRELADREPAQPPVRQFETRFAVKADFAGSASLTEHVLQIMLEGARNVRRHAFARTASIQATIVDGELRMRIDDDGLGFAAGAHPPWSIASRVGQLNGHIELDAPHRGGAHLAIAVRAA
jgi:signal transduction histidine kinase